ncbi:Gfo/Idh/MocA family oxidoreductase [Mesorhizobium sp. B2-5-4]|uniref:Gfo/Idh/MocA family protein n=1 Tax=unclassified Mesorhizobium TaxID=325217 RepID=UPI00112C573D|nr:MULTISPECIES: Gfo/Idh/MocA family oxidoreductase [unclassified Mesorhizobium]TPJ34715.1 Gfo/Idh/MocA family oxidoreductase [Mesorhizobium sp. B2-6-5]TPJ88200.1 Gfo/Idh/MocA family oxidoreductase [Mesorhizobium sp. B2-5-13]TPK44927.1 Gfo/Idh/MocA family oxidoreductase [Mesorhizobium sp. B2-5-4]TPK52395.1 Gfo/Idh/MocA family oxidoreductase [Mesorhizobium sp. B2-5-5]TPM05370.1 Gfo/Idh/MocA family oxidoreductase [Mesorhizobium sp. B2-3-11]
MGNEKPKLRVGLIGTGFMGKTHSFGFAAAERVFDLPFELELHTIADRTEELAGAAARTLGFKNATGDWRRLVGDPDIDLVDITAPNAFHREMALAAIAAGKHVYCEKPLAPRAAEAAEMANAAVAAGVRTQVGFNYLCNPMMALARELIATGELGEIRSYRGIHAEDYMGDAESPFTFRLDPVGGGALADLGSHALATAEFLLGPIERVLGDEVTVINSRPDGKGGRTAVEVDDIGRAFLRFASGATGSIEASWVASGRKMQHDFEIYGSRGALTFSQERFNELQFYTNADAGRVRGFRRIEAGPDHPPYGLFCVAPGHQLGFNDLKAIEVALFLEAIAGIRAEPFSFRSGQRIQELVEAIHTSATAGRWVSTV